MSFLTLLPISVFIVISSVSKENDDLKLVGEKNICICFRAFDVCSHAKMMKFERVISKQTDKSNDDGDLMTMTVKSSTIDPITKRTMTDPVTFLF